MLVLLVVPSLLLSPALAGEVAPPRPLTHDVTTLIVRGAPGHEEAWVGTETELVHVDLADGHVVQSLEVDPGDYGAFHVTTAKRKAHVTFPTGSFDLDGVRSATLAPRSPPAADGAMDLLLTTADSVTRVHLDGTQETIRAKGIERAAGLPSGHLAYSGTEGLTIHGPGTSCTLDAAKGQAVAPDRDGDPVLVRSRAGVLVVDTDCAPLAYVPLAARAATVTSTDLWVLTDDALVRYPRPGSTGGAQAPTVVGISGATGAAACGDTVCIEVGTLLWDPYSGKTQANPQPADVLVDRGARPRAAAWTLVGAQVDVAESPYALRAVPGGTRVVNRVTGHDVGVQLPRWTQKGVVSADGKLALLVDDDGPVDAGGKASRTTLFEVATGKILWTLPISCNPSVLTATAFVATQASGMYLVDTRSGREAFVLTRRGAANGHWLSAGLVKAPADWWASKPDAAAPLVASLGGATLPALQPVVAPIPADAGPADDPLRRASTPGSDHAGLPHFAAADGAVAARKQALGSALRSSAENPLEALATGAAWPEHASGSMAFAVTKRPMKPGRSVLGSTGVMVDGNPLALPLRAGRPTLVILGEDGAVPRRVLAAAYDPAVDVLWAGPPVEGPHGPSYDAPGSLQALVDAHDEGQTVHSGDFATELSAKLGIPNTGAMLVDPEGRVLAEGTLDVVEDLLLWRGLADLNVPKPLAADWAYTGPEPVLALAGLDDGGVAFATGRHLGVLDADGTLRWSLADPAQVVDTAGGLVISGTARGVVARDPATGATAWTNPGQLGITGRSFVLVSGHRSGVLLRAADGKPGGLAALASVGEPPPGMGTGGDALTFPFGEWTCSTGVTDAALVDPWAGCTLGQELDGAWIARVDGELTGMDADGDALWTLAPVSSARLDGPVVLAQLGTSSGPWATVDKKGKLTRLLLSDAPPDTAPGTLYGTVDGAIVAWKLH